MLEWMGLAATRAGTRVRTLLAQVMGFDPPGETTAPESFDHAEVVQPYGLLAHPAGSSSLEALVYRDGDEAVVIAMVDKGHPVTSIPAGETQIYGGAEPAAVIRILANGEIRVTPKSGQKIYLEGSAATADKPVAHEGSGTTGHMHGPGTMVAGFYPVQGLTASQTDTIATGQGSANVLVPDT